MHTFPAVSEATFPPFQKVPLVGIDLENTLPSFSFPCSFLPSSHLSFLPPRLSPHPLFFFLGSGVLIAQAGLKPVDSNDSSCFGLPSSQKHSWAALPSSSIHFSDWVGGDDLLRRGLSGKETKR